MMMIYMQNKINKTPETFVGRPPLFPLPVRPAGGLGKEGYRSGLNYSILPEFSTATIFNVTQGSCFAK